MSKVLVASKPKNIGEFYSKFGILLILGVIFLASSIFCEGFFQSANLTNVLRQIGVVTILAFGATLVIILGHINVAYGSELAFIGVISCGVMRATGNIFLAVSVAIVLGVFIGFLIGIVITKFGIPAFIMTLAVTTVARGFALIYTGGVPVSNLGNYTVIGQGSIGFMPISVIIMLVLFAITWLLLNKSCYGRHLYAAGGNINAAKASGIKVNKVVIQAFMFDGLMAAVAAVVFMSRMNSGQPQAGVSYEFDAITAVVVGGTSLSGGVGNVTGTLIGAVIVGIINNVQNLMNVSSYWQFVVKGVIILAAVIIDVKTKGTNKN